MMYPVNTQPITKSSHFWHLYPTLYNMVNTIYKTEVVCFAVTHSLQK